MVGRTATPNSIKQPAVRRAVLKGLEAISPEKTLKRTDLFGTMYL